MSGIFSALADPARRRLVELLAGGAMSLQRLASQAGEEQRAVARRLAALEASGLVSRTGPAPDDYELANDAVSALQAFVTSLSASSGSTPRVRDDEVDIRAKAFAQRWPGHSAEAYAIGQRLLRLADHVQQALKEAAASKELFAVDLLLLDILALADPPGMLTPSQLQSSLMLTKGGVTKCLIRLESRGLLRRLPDPRDGRGVLVQLTPETSDLMRSLVEQGGFGTDFVASMRMPPQRRSQLARLLREMLALADAEALGRELSGL